MPRVVDVGARHAQDRKTKSAIGTQNASLLACARDLYLEADVAHAFASCAQLRRWRLQLVRAVRHKRRGVLMAYLHLHKCMGSSFCRAARANMNSSRMPADNVACVAGWSPAAHSDALAARSSICLFGGLTAAQVHELPHRFGDLDFISAEGALPMALPLAAPVVWVTTLREPLSRLISSYFWWQEQPWARLPDIACHGYKRGTPPSTLTAARWLQQVPDNFMARSLCGRQYLERDGDRYQSSAGALVRCALQRLNALDVVTILEYPAESAKLLESRFGWRRLESISGLPTQWHNTRSQRQLSKLSIGGVAAGPTQSANESVTSRVTELWLRRSANKTLLVDHKLYASAVRRLLALTAAAHDHGIAHVYSNV
jgi:hypothetical protein